MRVRFPGVTVGIFAVTSLCHLGPPRCHICRCSFDGVTECFLHPWSVLPLYVCQCQLVNVYCRGCRPANLKCVVDAFSKAWECWGNALLLHCHERICQHAEAVSSRCQKQEKKLSVAINLYQKYESLKGISSWYMQYVIADYNTKTFCFVLRERSKQNLHLACWDILKIILISIIFW